MTIRVQGVVSAGRKWPRREWQRALARMRKGGKATKANEHDEEGCAGARAAMEEGAMLNAEEEEVLWRWSFTMLPLRGRWRPSRRGRGGAPDGFCFV